MKTIKIDTENTKECYINIEKKSKNNYSFCISGTNLDGLYFETPDFEGYKSKKAAEKAARKEVEGYQDHQDYELI